ncbi:hypothetical protein IMW75_24760 [Pseudomonas gregormendelii]|uniref:Lipoprotein n=1 Tax=Pseudomonas gregormendelii TaxID=1628277 RepID=A0ABS3AQ35_9PSED|nr:hypothetical protein [Pseudomonas gregormendelii]MBN3968470.1 hypothetical protein [Pseudomonas gregormendelii]
MVVGQKLMVIRGLSALVVPVASVLLAGCGGGNEPPKVKNAEAVQATEKTTSVDIKTADQAVIQQLAQENAPKAVTFRNPGLSELENYLDAKQPMTAFNLYNAKRDWKETPEDIADSIADAFNVRKVNPELYRLASARHSEQDSFKKKDLTGQLGILVGEEADKAKANNLVKLSGDDWTPISLSSYDSDAKGFRIDNCLFSDKVEYTDEEKRSATSMSRAGPLRCYLNPGPTSYYIGFQGGSSVLLDVADEALARKIEASKETIKIDIYGYVKSVERERFAGEFGPQRFVFIGPQRIDLKDGATGKIIFTKNI